MNSGARLTLGSSGAAGGGRAKISLSSPAAVYVTLFALTIAAFRCFPEVDLQVSQYFFSSGHFNKAPWLMALNRLPWLYGVAWGGVIAWSLGRRCIQYREQRSSWSWTALWQGSQMYLLVVILCIPVLLSHVVMKQVFHRPRPFDIVQFGGQLEFTKAWDISGGCSAACSLPSSHAAMGFLPYALLWVGRWRGWANLCIFLWATLGGLCFGLIRVALGHHFLSDVVFAGFIMYGGSWLIWSVNYWLIAGKNFYKVSSK